MHNAHNTPHTRRNSSSRGCQQRGYTRHVRIGGGPFPQDRKADTTYRVTWWVAGKRCGRTYHNRLWAQSFRQKLIHAARRGEPFDATSGFPLSFTATRPRRTTRHHHAPGAHHE